MSFDSTRSYDARLDVRDWTQWNNRLRGQPEGVLWALVGPRRSGKTWALRALQNLDTDYVDLKGDPAGLDAPTKACLLVDEPGPFLHRDSLGLIERCIALKKRGIRILVAMTPGEWECLAELDPQEKYVKARDRLALSPLSDDQALRLARLSWAAELLKALPIDWRRNPFLLELLFETAQDDAELRQRPEELIQRTIRASGQGRFRYVHYVLNEGLNARQRSTLRAVARGQNSPPESLLHECGLIREGPRIGDPIIASHFRRPVVVHHVSDLHFGPKTAVGVDLKEPGNHGKRFAGAMAGSSVREDYLVYLRALGPRAPHAVIISGDLVETGTDEQYTSARSFIDGLKAVLAAHPDLDGSAERVALVGGNHDVAWNETRGPDGSRRRHQPFAKHMEGYPHPRLDLEADARQLTTIAWPGVGVELVLLGSAEYGGEEDEVGREISSLLDRIVASARDAFDRNDLEKFDALCGHVSRLDPGLVHYQDLKRLEAHKWSQPLRIAVLHHPVSPMPVATEIARFGGLLNAGAVKTALLRAGVSLVLHGHQHSGWFSRESWPGLYEDRELNIAAAPTLGSRETAENLGFNEIRIFREGDSQYEVEVERIAYNGNGWDKTGKSTSFRIG